MARERWWHIFFNVHVFVILLIAIFAFYIIKNPKPKQDEIVGSFNQIILDTFNEKIELFPSKKFSLRKPCEKKNETRCREIMETLTGKPFVSIRPEWLKNPATGRNLELDGYNEELKLAFEYDGNQHSSFNPHFHKTPQDFVDQGKRDLIKDKLCKERGVTLIRIPSFVAFDDLERYIGVKLKDAGLDYSN